MAVAKIKKLIQAEKINMGGHLLDQALPNHAMDQLDPFLLIHHASWEYPGGQRSRDVGIGGHPHRGFSPVTFVFRGDIRHQDSLGNDKVVEAGGTQWMHAGKGITHSERPSNRLAKEGGSQEIIQFWVNTPAAHKMKAASYLPIADGDTPKIKANGSQLAVVAGTYQGLEGPADTLSPMLLLRGEVSKNSQLAIEIDPSFNTLLYTLDGHLKIDGQAVEPKTLAWLSDGDQISIDAVENTRFILLSGAPINEEVTSYGPFVMNTQTEILQALRDAQQGKMGVLIEKD